jgi:hypothetical protein
MTNKFAENVKRIVGIDRPQEADPNDVVVGGIGSTRGIGTQSFGGKTVSSTGGADTEETGTGSGGGINTNATEEEAKEEATEPNENDQDSLTKTPEAGVYDADKLIDGEEGPTEKSGVPDAFSNYFSIPGGNLSGINAIDCSTGDTLNIRVDGLYVPIDQVDNSEGNPISPAWPDPTTPPDVLGYEDGFYWSITLVAPIVYMVYPYDYTSIGGVLITVWGPRVSGGDAPGGVYEVGPSNFRRFFGVEHDGTDYWVQYQAGTTSTGPWGSPINSFKIFRNICPGPLPEYCPGVAPKETMWPEDETISLTKIDGKFQASQYDPDATPEYAGQDSSTINFCMDGGRTGRIEMGKNGGTILYETDMSGNPTGIIRYYDSTGALAAAGDDPTPFQPGVND